jgi:surface antigen Omp85-like protein
MRLRISAAILLCTGVLFLQPVAAQEAPRPIDRNSPPGLLAEPKPLTTALDMAGRFLGDREGEGADGFYPVMKTGVSGAGWITVGPGYRRHVLDKKAVVDGSASYSWRGYRTAQATFESVDLAGGRIVLGSQALYQDLTQLQHFGLGPDSQYENRADYRLRTADIVGYGKYRPTRWLAFVGGVGRLASARISPSSGHFDRNFPDAQLLFAADPGFNVAKQPSFIHSDISATADNRDYPGHPSTGGLYRVAVSRYTDRDLRAFSFDRREFEALHYIPVVHHRWTLALHGWTVISDANAAQQIPVYFLPSLGGTTTLRSYADYRFHDRNLLLVSAESRWALFRHIDAAVFIDAGSVAPRFRDLDLRRRSYGVGLRAHNHVSTSMRLDVAHGEEGWRLLFRLNEPFRLIRLNHHTAPVPFVP